MTSPTPQEQAEKLVRDYDLAKLLPCLCVYEDGQHEDDCPADYRPAVAQALSAKDAEINRLRNELGLFMIAVNCGGSWAETCEQIHRQALGETP